MSAGEGWLFPDAGPGDDGGGARDADGTKAADRVEVASSALEHRALGGVFPEGIRLGTSSWSFPGWAGLVYDRVSTESTLARRGLSAYASHPLLETVGLDRAFYRPLTVEQYAALGAQVPARFSFLVKAYRGLTNPVADEPGGRGGVANPLFLDASFARDEVVGPTVEGLGDRLGVLVFQFPPMSLDAGGAARVGGLSMSVMELLDRVHGFLASLPSGERRSDGGVGGAGGWSGYAVEFRNAEVLSPGVVDRYAGMLLDTGVSHSFAGHPRMPAIGSQSSALRAAGVTLARQRALVVRWLLRRDQTYNGARSRYLPFAHLRDADVEQREAIAGLIREAAALGRAGYVIVNNKAEGSAPRSIVELARSVVSGVD